MFAVLLCSKAFTWVPYLSIVIALTAMWATLILLERTLGHLKLCNLQECNLLPHCQFYLFLPLYLLRGIFFNRAYRIFPEYSAIV